MLGLQVCEYEKEANPQRSIEALVDSQRFATLHFSY